MRDSNELRNKIIYQIFVRQYGKNHNFADVRSDLKRIKEFFLKPCSNKAVKPMV